MATQTRASADAILKDYYTGPVVEALNQNTYLIDQIERDAESVDHVGRRAVFVVRRGRNRGRGSRGDAGVLPVAGRQDFVAGSVPIRYHYIGIEVSDAVISATKSDPGAFINVLDDEVKSAARDLRRDINRQCYGFGNGALTALTANATTGATSLTVASGQYIAIGDIIDVVDPSGTNYSVQGAQVTDVTLSGSTVTVTISPGLTSAANALDLVVVSGSYGNEMDGLINMTRSDVYPVLHGIDGSVAANSQVWQTAARRDAGGNVAGEDLFIQVIDAVGRQTGEQPDLFLTTRGIRRRLANQYQSLKRFNDAKAVEIHGGYTAIFVNEIPVVADDDCPETYAFAVKKDALRWFEQEKPGWLEDPKSGGIFELKDHTQAGQKVAVWQAWFRWYASFACKQRNKLAVIHNAQDDKVLQTP